MYIRLIRNETKGNAITGRLVIDGRWFCNTLERVGYQIPALCYHIAVTQSPKFKRLLPLVTGVPRTPQDGYGTATPIGRANGAMGYRQGIRFHRGSKPEHSTGCILVVGDNMNDNTDNLRPNQYPLGAQGEDKNQQPKQLDPTTCSVRNNTARGEGYDLNDNIDNLRPNQYPLGAQGEYASPRQEVDCRGMLSPLSSNKKNIGGRSAADVEQSLTQLLLQTQEAHEEIILEVTDFTPGTQYGYDHPCEPELQKP